MEIVRTRLCHYIDTATREATLTNIIRSDNHLEFLNGIHGDGVCTRLSAVGTIGTQTKHVVGHNTVDLETVVAIVRTYEGDTATLG